MQQQIIYHITTQDQWLKALDTGAYLTESFETEGFIHCSKFEQVNPTAKRYYAGRRDLILLEIDELSLGNTVKYEMAVIGELFPHIYGSIPVPSVVRVNPLILGSDGEFSWPVILE
jgi:uncharacterized protein (DUF952 family)